MFSVLEICLVNIYGYWVVAFIYTSNVVGRRCVRWLSLCASFRSCVNVSGVKWSVTLVVRRSLHFTRPDLIHVGFALSCILDNSSCYSNRTKLCLILQALESHCIRWTSGLLMLVQTREKKNKTSRKGSGLILSNIWMVSEILTIKHPNMFSLFKWVICLFQR